MISSMSNAAFTRIRIRFALSDANYTKKCSLMRIRNVFLSERESKYELQWASNRVCASPSERLTFNSQYQSIFYINLKQNDIAQY